MFDVSLAGPGRSAKSRAARARRACAELSPLNITTAFVCGPSKTTEYSVKNSPWRGGRGDVLRELSDACREFGLKFGVYISPWDRNHPLYGTPRYNKIYEEQWREILTNYERLRT
jgi:hypothetical protein